MVWIYFGVNRIRFIYYWNWYIWIFAWIGNELMKLNIFWQINGIELLNGPIEELLNGISRY